MDAEAVAVSEAEEAAVEADSGAEEAAVEADSEAVAADSAVVATARRLPSTIPTKQVFPRKTFNAPSR